MSRLAAILLLCLAGCANAQTVAQLCQQSQATIDTALAAPTNAEAVQLLNEAKGLIDQAIIKLNVPDPDPDPEPDPSVNLVTSSDDPQNWLLGIVDGGVNYKLLGDPKIDGFSIRVRASTVNPAKGKYDWTKLDKEIAEAKKYGKNYNISVLWGGSSPKWIGAQMFSAQWQGKNESAPIPWDTKLIAAYDEFMVAFGQRYASDPSLVAIHVMMYWQASEMHMPSPDSKWPTNTMTDVTTHRINVAAMAFPKQIIIIDHSPRPWAPAVRQWMMATLGKKRAGFQMNALKASSETDWEGFDIIRRMSEAGYPAGFQYVGPSIGGNGKPVERFGGSFRQGYDKGRVAKMHWHEIYQWDVKLLP